MLWCDGLFLFETGVTSLHRSMKGHGGGGGILVDRDLCLAREGVLLELGAHIGVNL